MRTARSPIFNQSHDFSCFVTYGLGRLGSQADGIPIHTGGDGFAVCARLDAFGGHIEPGDAFLLNDPYAAGGNHLPDWVVARPVFTGETLVRSPATAPISRTSAGARPGPTTRRRPRSGTKEFACQRYASSSAARCATICGNCCF